jgi:fucose 4-O-acetylase-like acetyltransferase
VNKNESVLDWVLIAKGIGIVLVVIGHFTPYFGAPDYYARIRGLIYTFHMPLFFLLSGFLYTYTKYSYSTLIKNKVKRLLIPFVSLAIIYFVVKYFSGMLFILARPVVGIQSVYAILVDPLNSYIPLLWFMYTLFLIFLIYPLLRKIINNNFVIIAIFIFINIFFGRDYTEIGLLVAHIPYFIVGVILRESRSLRDRIIMGKWNYTGVSLIFFTLMYIVFVRDIKADSQFYHLFRLILGASGAICTINISHLIDTKIKIGIIRTLWLQTGLYSMSIYLIHGFFESPVRIGFNQMLAADFYMKFEVAALIAILAGVAFPIFLEKMILRKNRFAKKYILGLG